MAGVSRGAAGEILAARFLRDNGYQIIGANVRSRFGEIDLIATKGRYIVFVEVKTRGANALYEAKEAVTAEKQKKIAQTAALWMSSHPQEKRQPRFDVIEVYTVPSQAMKAKEIHHIQHAFETGGLGRTF